MPDCHDRRAGGPLAAALEALTEDVRILELLLAHKQGAITAMEFVEQVRGAVPDPLAGQKLY